MRILSLTAILLFLNVLSISCEETKVLVFNENLKEVKELVCKIFPKALKEICNDKSESKSKLPDVVKMTKIDAPIERKSGMLEDSLAANRKKSDERCGLCKLIVSYYAIAIDRSLNATDIQQSMLGLCGILNSKSKNHCISFFKTTGFRVIKSIVLNPGDPQKVCQIMKLCLQRDELFQYQIFLDFSTLFLPSEKPKSCLYCKNAFHWLVQNINSSNSATDIQNVMLGYCKIMNSGGKTFCEKYFSTTGFDIITGILNQTEPRRLCQDFGGFCTQQKVQDEESSIQAVPEIQRRKKSDEPCEICERIIQSFELGINKSLNPTDIQKTLINGCDVFEQPVKSRCVAFYQNVGIKLIKAVFNKENPKSVCKRMKLCLKLDELSGHYDVFDMILDMSTNKSPKICTFCKSSVRWIEKNINSSKPYEEDMEIIYETCDLLKSPYREVCRNYFSEEGIHVIKTLLSRNDSLTECICQYSHFCPVIIPDPDLLITKEISPKKPAEMPCEICEQIIMLYEIIVNKSLDPTDIQKAVTNICEIYNQPLKNQCIKFYKGIGLKVIKSILRNENPRKTCQQMGLCLKTWGINEYYEFFESMTKFLSKADTTSCSHCATSLKSLEKNINTSKTPNDVQNIMFGICQVFSNIYQSYCVEYYTQEGLTVIEMILEKEDPKTICQNIGFCPNKNITENVVNIQDISRKHAHRPVNKTCRICTNIIRHYERYINQSLDPNNVQKVVIDACEIYKQPSKDKCITFYKGAGFELIKSILKHEDPLTICQGINLCQNTSGFGDFYILFNTITNIQSNRQRSDVCKSCATKFLWLEKNINSSKTPKEFQTLMVGICSVFKSPYNGSCTHFYSRKGLLVIKMLLKQENPKRICQQIHFCPKHKHNTQLPSFDSKEISLNRINQSCHQCKISVKYYERTLNTSQDPVDIQNQILAVCEIYNQTMKDQCIAFYQGIGFEVIKAILNSEKPENVCQIIQICVQSKPNNLFTKFHDFTLGLFSKHRNHCAACKTNIRFQENSINASKTAVEVQQIVTGACNIFKRPYSNKCRKFYSTTGYDVIKSILKKENPEKVCKKLHYCKRRNEQINTKSVNKINDEEEKMYKLITDNFLRKLKKDSTEERKASDIDNCMLCRQVTFIVDRLAKPNIDETSVTEALIKACLYLPIANGEQCDLFVTTYRGPLINLFVVQTDWQLICQKLGICQTRNSIIDSPAKDSSYYLPKTTILL